jgi:DNA repair protein SbcC/Rad50
MIKTLKIENYQSHEKTFLNFHSGVNVIVGSSRSGKTSILRNLIWGRYNKPTGTAFNSYWNRDKKKNQINKILSEVTFEEGSIASRIRDNNLNAYEVNGEKYEAIKDFPEQVNNVWNMSEVNFQKQFSQPFLLSESSAEVARFFNKIINLDKIDVVLSKAENSRRKINQQIEAGKVSIAQTKKGLEELSWVGPTSDLIESAIIRESCLAEKDEKVEEITDLLSDLEGLNETLQSIPENIEGIFLLIEEAEAKDAKIEDLIKKENSLYSLCRSLEEQQTKSTSIDLDGLERDVLVIEEQHKKVSELNDKANRLYMLILSYQEAIVILLKSTKIISEIESEFPNTCPYCGAEIKEGDNCNERIRVFDGV